MPWGASMDKVKADAGRAGALSAHDSGVAAMQTHSSAMQRGRQIHAPILAGKADTEGFTC